MGRFTLSIQQKSLSALTLLLLSTQVLAKEVAGVNIPETYDCGGKTLPFQGAGLRTATWIKIKVYVLAYYAAEKKAPATPSCFNLTYLRDFDQEDVDKAWAFQFKDSSMHPYPQLEEHVKEIQQYFGEIKGERSENFVLEEGSTKIYENGILKGEIKGAEFQKNFLSLWFGKKPPTKELQEELLK
jgi:hypothetical protein